MTQTLDPTPDSRPILYFSQVADAIDREREALATIETWPVVHDGKAEHTTQARKYYRAYDGTTVTQDATAPTTVIVRLPLHGVTTRRQAPGYAGDVLTQLGAVREFVERLARGDVRLATFKDTP